MQESRRDHVEPRADDVELSVQRHVDNAMAGRCEEASPLSGAMYIPCGAEATHLVYSSKDRRHYAMCWRDALTNVQRRGMVFVSLIAPIGTHELIS